jgi:LCP family protein required for cell wall assembly
MTRRVHHVLAAAVLLTVSLAAAAEAGQRWLAAPVGDGVITLLLLGSDAGPPRGGSPTTGRADAFHLLFVSEDRQHATIVNVARDAWVPVPGRGRSKINACLVGGPQRCVDTVEQVFGIDVDHHLVTSMHGMAEAFEAFGGVEVDVPRALRSGGPDIGPGRQRLNGYEALTYARDRKLRPGGDFERSEAQAELLALAHAAAVRDADLGSIARTVGILHRHVETDASAADLLRYGYAALGLPPDNVTNVTLPGTAGWAGAASVVHLSDRATALVRDAADGRLDAPR